MTTAALFVVGAVDAGVCHADLTGELPSGFAVAVCLAVSLKTFSIDAQLPGGALFVDSTGRTYIASTDFTVFAIPCAATVSHLASAA